jgi:RNA ligase (TIGR02306 family)
MIKNNERKLATIQKIINIEPIADADKIEKATVLGWSMVVKKNEFKIKDLCIYIEIDSIVPDIPYFEFMRERKFRVKTIKLRGVLSQGLLLPLSFLNEFGNLLEKNNKIYFKRK